MQNNVNPSRIPVLHARRRNKPPRQQQTTSSIRTVAVQTEDEHTNSVNTTSASSSRDSKLNPMAQEFQPTLNASAAEFQPQAPQTFQVRIFPLPIPPTEQWDVFAWRAQSSSPELPPIEEETEEEPDFPGEILRDDDTGKILDNSSRVYKLEALMAYRLDPICQESPLMIIDLTCDPARVDQAICGMDKPIVLPPVPPRRVGFGPKIRPQRPIPRPKPRPRPKPKPMLPKQPTLSEAKRRRERMAVPQSELTKLMAKARGILNRITPENFERLLLRLTELIQEKVSCCQHLEAILDAVVGVAVMQPKFAERYVELLSKLTESPEIVASLKDVDSDQNNVIKSMVRELCRKWHEEYWFRSHPARLRGFIAANSVFPSDVSNIIADFSPPDDDEFISKMKSKFLGVELFLAQMCKQEVLSKKLIFGRVIHPLLRIPFKDEIDEDAEWRNGVSASEVEAVCKMLTVVGFCLEKRAPKWMDGYFNVLEQSVENLDSRMKFMVMDLRDLRDQNWGEAPVVDVVERRPTRPVHREDVSRHYRDNASAHSGSFRSSRRRRSRYVPRQ